MSRTFKLNSAWQRFVEKDERQAKREWNQFLIAKPIKTYTRRCHRCDLQYKTFYHKGKICNKCNKREEHKK